jgi:DNA-binding winged helix-turn-helix (wHTH) protein
MGQVKFKFDNHILDTDRRELRRDGNLVAMQPQVFDLLVSLLVHRDRVVTRDDLIAL